MKGIRDRMSPKRGGYGGQHVPQKMIKNFEGSSSYDCKQWRKLSASAKTIVTFKCMVTQRVLYLEDIQANHFVEGLEFMSMDRLYFVHQSVANNFATALFFL